MTSGSGQWPVAVITGASSGIGAETAMAFSRRGYAVVLGSRRLDKLQDVARRCLDAGAPAAEVLQTDVADRGQVEALVNLAVERLGRLDVMVNNAGYGHFAAVTDIEESQLRRIFDVNFYGVFYGCQAAAAVMRRQGSGHIFNVSSVIGKRGTPFHGAYVATKFAVTGLSDSLRVEMLQYNVKVTTVCPALTATGFFDVSENGRRAKSSFVKLKRMMSPAAVARKIAATAGKTKPELVFTLGGKFLVVLSALWPRAADRIMKVYHDDLARRLQNAEHE